MTVTKVKSCEEFQKFIASSRPLVVCFVASWSRSSLDVIPKLEEFSSEYPAITFIKVNTVRLEKIAYKYYLINMPAFHFYKNGNRVDELFGADVCALKAKIEQLAD